MGPKGTRGKSPRILAALGLAALTASLPAWAFFHPAQAFPRGAVASDNAEASAAGASVLRAGGNAVDAAIATALALGVASPSSSGFGGGGFATVCTRDGACTFIDFRETAPAALTVARIRAGSGPRPSGVGGLAVGVPGEPLGFTHLSRTRGRLPLSRVVAPAVALAQRGITVTPWLAARARDDAANLSLDPFLSRVWLPGGRAVEAGVRVRRAALGATLARYGREGEGFVRGAFARAVAAAASARGGVITAEDVAGYRPVEREPLRGAFRGYTVVTAPYPSAGGLVVLQTLAMLEGASAPELLPGSAAYLHRLAESWRGSFDDRARYVGDPANPAVVPASSLLAPERMARRRARFDPSRAQPVTIDDPARDRGTTHLCVMDAEGTVVSLTTTVNDLFGARLAVPSMDVLLNDEVDDFSLGEGTSYGLAASPANALAPGRRPASSMAPTVILRDGRPVGCVGGAGGPRIATATTQVLLNLLLHGMDPEAAVSAPRAHHQGAPDELRVEAEVAEDVRASLRARGHAVVASPPLAVTQALWVVGEGAARRVLAASDPRKHGAPAGH